MITVEFKDFEDMMGFARNLVSTVETKEPIWTTPAKQAIQQTVQPSPVPLPPVQQASPVTPPIQQAVPATPPVQQASPVTTPPIAPPTYNVPTTAARYTEEDLARGGAVLMETGKQNDLLNLLAQFGVESLHSLSPAQYGAFATALRGLGAPI